MFMMNVHEMEPHDTLITSLVFNGGYSIDLVMMIRLILLVVLPLLQFCSKAFGDFAAQSEVIDILFCDFFWKSLICTYFWSSD